MQIQQLLPQGIGQIGVPVWNIPVGTLTRNLFTQKMWSIAQEVGLSAESYLDFAIAHAVEDACAYVEGPIDWNVIHKEVTMHANELFPNSSTSVSEWIELRKGIEPMLNAIEENPMRMVRALQRFGERIEKIYGPEVGEQMIGNLILEQPFPQPASEAARLWVEGHAVLAEELFGKVTPEMRAWLASNMVTDWIEEAVNATADSAVLSDPVVWNQFRLSLDEWLGAGALEPKLCEFVEIASSRYPDAFVWW